MTDLLIYREMMAGEEQLVCDLVKQVFMEFVAPDYRDEGIREFLRFANPEKLSKRLQSGGFVLVACQSDKIVGMIEFVPPERIALLFVSIRHRGIARELVARATDRARSVNTGIEKIKTHSSPYAESFYSKIGFKSTGEATTDHGIRYIPMELSIIDNST